MRLLWQGGLDNISMFSLITIASLLLLLPCTLAAEGFQLTPERLRAMVRAMAQVPASSWTRGQRMFRQLSGLRAEGEYSKGTALSRPACHFAADVCLPAPAWIWCS
jgi:hypothetical protein